MRLRHLLADIPHFDLPLRFNGGAFAEIEQDSLDDIVNCIVAAIKTEPGFRTELPTFGATDLTFQVQPVNVSVMTDQILLHEPRAQLLIEQHPDLLQQIIARVSVQVTATQEDAFL